MVNTDKFKKWMLENSINNREIEESKQIGIWLDTFEAMQNEQPELSNNSKELENKNGELISRQEAVDVLNRGLSKIPYVNNTDTEMIRRDERIGCIQEIRELPSVQPRKGKWIYGEHDIAMCDGYRCDKCGFFVPWDYQHKFIDFIKDYNYCPSCGADMRSEAREYLEYGKLIAKGIEQGLRGDAE